MDNHRTVYFILVTIVILVIIFKIVWDTIYCSCKINLNDIFVYALTVIFGLLAIWGSFIRRKGDGS